MSRMYAFFVQEKTLNHEKVYELLEKSLEKVYAFYKKSLEKVLLTGKKSLKKVQEEV